MGNFLDEIMDEAACLRELNILPAEATEMEILQTLDSISGLDISPNSVAARLAISSFHNAVVTTESRQLH